MSTKISQLTSATDVTANDLIQIVDVEDGVMAPSGTNKKATASLLAKELAKQPLEPGVVISGSSSGDAVRITQTGSGNAIVVEDSSNPDATPFVVANTGNVGIGTQFPISPLDVQGNATFRGNDGYAIFAPKSGTSPFGTNFDRFEIYVDPSNPQTFIGNTHGGTGSPRDLVLSAGNSERLRITSTGNVGIGTNSPTAKLNVVDNTSNDAVRITQTGSGNALVVEDSTNPDSTPFVISNDGVVRINQASSVGAYSGIPAFLQINEGTYVAQSVNRFTNDDLGANIIFTKNRGTESTNVSVQNNDELGLLSWFGANGTSYSRAATIYCKVDGSPGDGDMPGKLVFATTADGSFVPTAHMFIDSVGRVGIGIDPLSYQLQLGTDSAAKPSTSTWTISSDERLKENIEAADLDICYNAVKNIPLKRYKWKDEIYSTEQVTDRSKIGWIAQDVQAVFPKAVNEHKFVYNQVKDEDGNVVSEDSIDDCLSLNSDQIYAALFGAVQKLMGEVESLQGRIAELEAAP